MNFSKGRPAREFNTGYLPLDEFLGGLENFTRDLEAGMARHATDMVEALEEDVARFVGKFEKTAFEAVVGGLERFLQEFEDDVNRMAQTGLPGTVVTTGTKN